ncbi:MAG: nuclear transport factor 2 family protein [Actinomycetota bacterium]
MSQENVELVHRITAAINRHDIDAVLALTDPDVEFIPRLTEVDGGGSYRGHDGVRSWWENLFGVWPDFKSEVKEVRDLGDVTVAQVRMSGQGIASQVATDQTSWVVNEWRSSKAIWMRVFQSEAEALEAAGLRE